MVACVRLLATGCALSLSCCMQAVVQKKQLKQKEEQMMKMCDAMYELEQQVGGHANASTVDLADVRVSCAAWLCLRLQIKALGGTPADNYSEQFEEQMNEANHPRGSPSAGAALASQAESKDGDDGGVDPVAMVALKQENKALKRSLADAQAAAGQVRELQAQLAEAQAASNEGAAPSGGSPTVDTAALEEARSQVRPVLSWQLRCTHRSFCLAPALTWCFTCPHTPRSRYVQARAAEAEKQHLAKQLEEAQEASQRATRDLNVAQKASSDLESRVQALTAQLASVASGDDAAAAASAAAAEQVAALQAEKSSLEERVQGLEDEVAATRKTAEKLERKVTKARDAAQQQYDLATQLQEELVRGLSPPLALHHHSDCAPLACIVPQDATKARLDAASSNAGASEGAVADLQAKVAGLEAKVADADERNAALERQLDDAKSAMSAAAGEAEAVLQKQLAQKEQELETARADVKEAQDANNANIEAAQAALATWKEKYTTVKNERKQYKHQLQAVAADMQRLEAELAAKSEEVRVALAWALQWHFSPLTVVCRLPPHKPVSASWRVSCHLPPPARSRCQRKPPAPRAVPRSFRIACRPPKPGPRSLVTRCRVPRPISSVPRASRRNCRPSWPRRRNGRRAWRARCRSVTRSWRSWLKRMRWNGSRS